MRIFVSLLVTALLSSQVLGDILVPVRTIRAKEIIGSADLVLKNAVSPGAISAMENVVGFEARKALFPDRPIHSSDIGPPALVERNQLVTLVFRNNGLQIETEGRAMGRGAAGETVRVLNVASRTTLSGQIQQDGTIEVR